ncbi:MFS transporter [Spartinivicinus poritis]|uniref:MFS transporter n=1 Tax=Spartinivicinus poritis TaxID=2994640 RepID=A0ABT5U914_9GAMM|nr:MFS transporter [Spartinivicinus sp. A2-2]MDE1462496.1 MFS transporter [Spartinivicinus sp. A2-2]
MSNANRKSIWSWALYDWANSAFATVVMAGFFPIFFKQFWSSGVPVTESTYQLGMINSVASLIVVAMSPILGVIADQLGRRKGLLLLFACFGAVMTGGLYWVEKGEWQVAAALYVCALIGFSSANLFYDALLPIVSPSDWLDRVSALGFALGYLGGGLLFTMNVWMTLKPEVFGLANSADAVQLAFLLTALWWILFSMPLWLFVKETNQTLSTPLKSLTGGFKQLRQTLRKIHQLPQTYRFLIAYWLYIDGVDTIIRMAVDYGLAIGLDSNDLITALLLTQFIGFPAALVFGRIGERYSPRTAILLALTVYIMVTLYSIWMHSAWQFYLLAGVIGLVQGGVQALSRSLYSRLIPVKQTAEFFGFYNMLGKFAAVLGPILVGWVTILSGSNRIGILSILLLFLLGGYLLLRVDVSNGEKQAARY